MLADGLELGGGVITHRVETGPEATPSDLEKAVEEFLAFHRLEPTVLGIAVPGLVEHGRVKVSDVLPQLAGWAGFGDRGVPAVLVNDIRGALAQETATLSKSTTAAVVMCGTAVGSAYLSEGRVIRGARGWAGEIGSLPMTTPQGVRRLDDLAGGGALVRAAGMPPPLIRAALADEDHRVQDLVRAAGEAFGLALASLVNLLNPDVVRVAGGTLGYQGYWDAALKNRRRPHTQRVVAGLHNHPDREPGNTLSPAAPSDWQQRWPKAKPGCDSTHRRVLCPTAAHPGGPVMHARGPVCSAAGTSRRAPPSASLPGCAGGAGRTCP
ncbi:ROK family protein [Streptomyces sp. CA-251247]|uniref:ROK family protein n=1 Tax=Streptomyces sp. CA-251247 TaxID=3240062 RepID=UPI003D947B52